MRSDHSFSVLENIAMHIGFMAKRFAFAATSPVYMATPSINFNNPIRFFSNHL
jgi:hypothetical protein